jgi:2,4-dienoyl-CoA reductase-like NADH-dependent reductase (Old Yellow Enzyme family)
MFQHEPFRFRSGEALLVKAAALGVDIPYHEDITPLFQRLRIDTISLPNRLAVHPMEGCDADVNGAPGDFTCRRYKRYAEGGSGLIWFEATSITPDGRSNPHQLWLNGQSLEGFKALVDRTKRSASKKYGSKHSIFCVLQLTHSGRYSRPQGKPKPYAVWPNPFLDKDNKDLPILSDEELLRIQDDFVEAARLAFEAGFDAVDIKACHGYLINELLAAFERKNSRLGGPFENRIRFLVEVTKNIRREVPGIHLAVRLSAFDGIPYPYGFGAAKDSSLRVDLSEPKRLISVLVKEGCFLINVTVGNPRQNPYMGRPFDRSILGITPPPEHPLQSIARLVTITGELQKEFPDVPFVGTGYSWLRQFFPHVGAGVIHRGLASLIGLGRSSFAYPGTPRDLMNSGALNPKKVCITCSRCSELMQAGEITGCAVRDKAIYGNTYRKLNQERKG